LAVRCYLVMSRGQASRNYWGSVPGRQEERMEVEDARVQTFTWIFFFFLSPSDLKSPSSTWWERCPTSYRVQRGNRLPCCPRPTALGASARPRRRGAWFSQSQSSRSWPSPYCRERTTGSCRSPAETRRDNGTAGKTGKHDITFVFVISLPVLLRTLETTPRIHVCLCVSLCVCACETERVHVLRWACTGVFARVS